MNRVNKYRGQRCNDGQWVYGYYVESNSSWAGHKPHKSWIVTSVMSNGGFFNVMGRYAVKDDTVGQFIGLTDKNGQDVYEGDIVEVEDTHDGFVTKRCTVEFIDFGFWLVLDRLNEDGKKIYVSMCNESFKVVGNIHEV